MSNVESIGSTIDGIWRVELRKVAAFEQGFIAVLMRDPQASAYEFWARRTQSFDAGASDLLRRKATEVSRARGDAMLAALRGVSLAAVPPLAIGLGGIAWSLAVQAGFNSATYQWWCDLPDEWRGLQPALDRLAELVAERLREGSL